MNLRGRELSRSLRYIGEIGGDGVFDAGLVAESREAFDLRVNRFPAEAETKRLNCQELSCW